VDRLFEEAVVLDVLEPMKRDELFVLLAETLSDRAGIPASIIRGLLEEREKVGSTALTETVAFPHLVLPGTGTFVLVVARCTKGVRFSDGAPAVNAVFLLAGTMDRRTLHLRALAAIAQIIQSQDFDKRWRQARNQSALRGLLMAGERRRFQGT
jgi:mannitol/fructose-specific phosphotransferase system IIA component (Ntr-type)